MTTLELYRKHKAGEIGHDRFLYEVRRDKNLPWVTNMTSYDDAVKILKNKGVVSEAPISENFEVIYTDQNVRASKEFRDLAKAMAFAKKLVSIGAKEVDVFRGPVQSTADTSKVIAWYGDGTYMDNKSKEDPKLAAKRMSLSEADENIPTDPAVDRVNPYFLKRGVNMLLSKEKELTNDSYIKALNKAAKALEKNPHAYDEEMFANAKDIDKADEKLEVEEIKKGNLNDTDNEQKKVKVKSLKEAALEELANSLKKKDLVNEDSHWHHNVGSEVHTPDGKGTVKEIVGGTLTVEFENGTQKDFQINTIDHFTQKAREAEPVAAASKDDVKDMWAKWDKQGQKPFAGMIADPETFKKPLDMSKIKQYMEMYKHDKEKMANLKKAIKERIDVVKGRNATTGEDEVLAVVPGGQGAKAAQALKSKGATSVTSKPVA